MSLLGFGGPKAFVVLGNVSHDGTTPLVYFNYILVDPDGTLHPGPVDTWWTGVCNFDTTDIKLTIQTKIKSQIWLQEGNVNLNVVFLW